MTTPVRLAIFGLVLAVAFGVAWGAGAALGDPEQPTPTSHSSSPAAPHAGDRGTGETDSGPAHAPDLPGGLMVAESGYRLDLPARLEPGEDRELSFRILQADGHSLTAFEVSHDKRMHVIAVRRDQTGFQHVHPKLAADGTWSVPVDLRPGTWRVFADFVPGTGPATGETLTLGGDVQVPGTYAPRSLPVPATTTAVDGYTITLDGRLTVGEESELSLTVSRHGRPVADLQPYLAAYGHLVVLRAGDLAYLHAHPAGSPGDGQTAPGPRIEFIVSPPSAGTYRLYLDFRHEDQVRTAELTVQVGPPATTRPRNSGPASTPPTNRPSPTSEETHSRDDHGHGG
jgi:hypothetical protein